MTDDARDQVRREIADRGLTPEAVTHLTRDALGRVDLDQLAPLKQLLKRFFSDQPWSAADDDALAAIAGPGDGWWDYVLGDGSQLAFGWRDGRFRLDVASVARGDVRRCRRPGGDAEPPHDPVRDRPGAHRREPVVRLRRRRRRPARRRASSPTFDEVDNVLVGPEFVAVGVQRPDRWEQLLAPMLRLIESAFPPVLGAADAPQPTAPPVPGDAHGRARSGAAASGRSRVRSRVEGPRRTRSDARRRSRPGPCRGAAPTISTSARSRRDCSSARRRTTARPDGSSSSTIRAASCAARSSTRWSMPNASRSGRCSNARWRDADAWIRWKALRGLVELGVDPSRTAVTALAEDADFRVRLEAAGALRAGPR